jgi:3-keto-L-gulonate-6-phosphate decarboxylase
MSNFMKLRTVGAGLFHTDVKKHRQTDVQTDLTKLTVDLSNFANEQKKGCKLRLTGGVKSEEVVRQAKSF